MDIKIFKNIIDGFSEAYLIGLTDVGQENIFEIQTGCVFFQNRAKYSHIQNILKLALKVVNVAFEILHSTCIF